MKSSQVAAQLYCFRDFIQSERGLNDTFRRLRGFGYEAVQITSALPKDLSEKTLKKLLDDNGLTAVSSHENSRAIIEETDRIVDRMLALGIPHLAYPFPHFAPTGLGEVIGLAEKLNELALKFRERGITLAYHNHAVEFRRFEGRMMLETIYEHAPDLQGEIDTHWVQRGGGNPLEWIERLAGRMDVIHLKDYGVDTADIKTLWSNVPVMKPIGQGNLPWREIVAASEKAGVKVYVVEHDKDVPDPFASFEQSFKYLADNFIR